MKRNALLLTAVALALGGLPATANAYSGMSRAERHVVWRVNEVRARFGLAPLSASRGLARAAGQHSHDMIRRDFFDHSSSDGTPFDRRVHRYVGANLVGETIAAVSARRGAAALTVQLWMQSPPHRAVLLTNGFRRLGVGRVRGRLSGARRTVFTADFASRR
jgi:uncharacterized protein YkwD